MSSVLERSEQNRIFLIYGDLDDMFMTRDLRRCSFRVLLNGYLKSLGYEEIVFYSGAKNVGKFVLDDESAIYAINRNKEYRAELEKSKKMQSAQPVQTAVPLSADVKQNVPAQSPPARKRRRIMNPNAAAAVNATASVSAAAAEPAPVINSAPAENTVTASENPPASTSGNRRLVYKQPKITPVEFLDEAKKMMSDGSRKSAVVFTFLQDFFTDRSAPLQPYLELVSHLWDEYGSARNSNICIFLAPQMSASDLNKMFDNMENGYVLKNRFFNDSGTVNRRTTIEVGLPNADEIGYMLDYLRIVGVNGKHIEYKQSERKKLISDILFLSNEAEKDENRSGYLYAVFSSISDYMKSSDRQTVTLDEAAVKRIYARYKLADDTEPLEKLKNTRGWESVADRISEIVRDCRMKKAAAEKKDVPDLRKSLPACSNERIDTPESTGYRYPVPHFILRGNPGVGKTTVARLIGQILHDEGILLKGTTIEAKRDDLVDQYIGGTAIKTTECVERAQEGVLFIDDAYSLIDKSDEGNFAKEAIDTLVPIMTNPEKYRFCMIMAGYPEPMDELLEMNSGLRSRFSRANILTIDDYKPDLLRDIFVSNCRKDGYRFSGEGGASGEEPLDLDLFFKNLYDQRNRADFGNARDIVALAKEVKMQCSLRDDVLRRIEKQDFGESAKYFDRHGVSSIDEIYAKIDKYVGMGFVKDLFKNIRFEVLDTIDSKKRGITPEQYPDHYIFAGNPGTGKTTVGKMIGELYHVMGVLGGTETLFVDASDVIGEHVGESKTKINEVMQKAIDHNQVLYIDEAYQISDSAYGNEVVGAMMTKMTENADDFKMIFGMYSNKVEEFLKMNAGLARRVRVVNFPDYTPDQLLEIFDRTIKAQGCTITEEAHERMKLIFTYKYNTRGDDFGNAGEVKKTVIDMKRLRLERTYGSDDPDLNRYEYTIADIPKDLLKMTENMADPKSFDDIMRELGEQIGMSDLKDIIVHKQEEIIFAQKSGESTDNIRPGYYFFVGNPGTGKSTSAKLFAECLHKLGVVKTDNFYSCTAKDLIGQYVGETDKKTWALLQKSVNSVLFIDEAYSLSYDGENSGANYKKEALEQIIAFMDDPEHRKSCCIIFAGYEKDMQGLYRSNSGMRSRIEEVRFKDYTAKETYDIFALFCRRNGFRIADGVEEIYVPMFEKMKRYEYFSNGRTARTVYEKTTLNLKRRVVRSDNISGDAVKLILPEDLLSEAEAVAIVSDER